MNKIVIDLSEVGLSWELNSFSRGVGRVADALFKGVIKNREYESFFISNDFVYGSFQKLLEVGLDPSKLLHSGQSITAAKYACKIRKYVHSNLDDKSAIKKAIRKTASETAHLLNKVATLYDVNKTLNADIYHSPVAPIPQKILASKIKKFITIHDLLPITFADSVDNVGLSKLNLQLESVRKGAHAFCVSEHVRSELLSVTNCHPEQTTVTPLAASSNIFYNIQDQQLIQTILKKYSIPNNPYFLALSSFDKRKNFTHILDCFLQLLKSNSIGNANLVIVGSNHQKNQIIKNNIEIYSQFKNRIFMPGFVKDEDLAPLYSGAIAFLFPSIAEGFGMPPLEAMQCGTPVISSNTTSIPEVVGNAGVLLDPHDHDSWCQHMIRVFESEEMRFMLSSKGILRSKLFSWEEFMSRVISGYKS